MASKHIALIALVASGIFSGIAYAQDIEVDVSTACATDVLAPADYKTQAKYRQACYDILTAATYEQITSHISTHVALTASGTTYDYNMRFISDGLLGISGQRMDRKTSTMVPWLSERKVRKGKVSQKWTRSFRNSTVNKAIREFLKGNWQAYKAETTTKTA